MFVVTPTVSNSSNAAVHKIIHQRGDTFNRKFRFWQDDAKTIPLDISTSVWKMDIATLNNQTLIRSFRIGDGLSFIGTNVLSIDMDYIASRIAGGTYKYDLEQTLADGVTVKTRFKGPIIIESDVTPVSPT